MEIQKYNVIVYIMLVLKKNTCVSHPLKKWLQFSIARFTQSSLAKSVRRSASRQSWGDFHCNIRGPAPRIGVGVFTFIFSCNMEVLIICIRFTCYTWVYHLQMICMQTCRVVSLLLYDSIGQFSFFLGVGSYYI